MYPLLLLKLRICYVGVGGVLVALWSGMTSHVQLASLKKVHVYNKGSFVMFATNVICTVVAFGVACPAEVTGRGYQR